MLSEELKRLIKKEVQISEKCKRAWTPWRRILNGELEKSIGCVYRGCKIFSLFISYHVESYGAARLCACTEHADHKTLRNNAHKKYRHHIPLQVGVTFKTREEFFNTKELQNIRDYDAKLALRFVLEQQAKAGDVDAYKILQERWHVRLPLLEELLTKFGHWP